MKDKTPVRLTEFDRAELVASIAERAARRGAVDWNKWRNLPEVRVWQAVALSLGIEPSAVFPTGRAEEWAIAREGQDFRGRLEVVVANLAGQYEDDRGPFPDVGALPVLQAGTYGRPDAWISSSAFRSWAASIGWTMPPQFTPQSGGDPTTEVTPADHLAVIAAMLVTIKATRGISQGAVIVEIQESEHVKGLSKATLEKVFAAANSGSAKGVSEAACTRCIKALLSVLEVNNPDGPADRAAIIEAIVEQRPGLSSQKVSDVLAAP